MTRTRDRGIRLNKNEQLLHSESGLRFVRLPGPCTHSCSGPEKSTIVNHQCYY